MVEVLLADAAWGVWPSVSDFEAKIVWSRLVRALHVIGRKADDDAPLDDPMLIVRSAQTHI